MKRVLVTGGTGFVGANLVRHLLREGHELHLLVRNQHSAWRIENLRQDVDMIEVNLTDVAAVERVFARVKPEWVFHLAVHGAYSWQTDLQQMIDTNITGTANLVRAGLRTGFETFINTGSSSEYGFKAHAPSEDDWLEPNSDYAVTKASSTQYCRHISKKLRVNMLTLRLYSTFGPYEEPNRLVPALAVHGLRGKLPPLASPEIARDYIYINDVCEAYLDAATHPSVPYGSVYNVGSGIQTTLRDIVHIARRLLDIKSEPVWDSMPNRQWDTTIWFANRDRITKELGWEPRYSIESGFRAFADWLQSDATMRAFYETKLGLIQQ